MSFVCRFIDNPFGSQLLHVELHDSFDLSLASFNERIASLEALSGSHGYSCIVDISALSYLSFSAMKSLEESIQKPFIHSIAVLSTNPVSDLIFAVFEKRTSFHQHIQVFRTLDSAFIWLHERENALIA